MLIMIYEINHGASVAIFKKAKQHDNPPPLEKNNLTYSLRRKSFQRPKIKTERYKNTFVNRLTFKCNLL